MARYLKVTLWSAGIFLLIGYQNCAKLSFETIGEQTSLSEQLAKIIINDDSEFTNKQAVTLALTGGDAAEMYITNTVGCGDGGQWEPFGPTKQWSLAEVNSAQTVYAKYRDVEGKETACVSDAIIHDDLGPELTIKDSPELITNIASARFVFEASDSLSGVLRLECALGTPDFALCTNEQLYADLSEATHELQVRAIDKAGNYSEVVNYAWLVDVTPPVVTLIKVPNSTKNVAEFGYTAVDSGSGIDSVICQWNNDAEIFCTKDPVHEVNEGANVFGIWAIDKAGNVATKVLHNWLVDLKTLGEFDILGVTGGGDKKVDLWLAASKPTVHWSKSVNSVGYIAQILDATQSREVCQSVATVSTSSDHTSCEQLQDNTSYVVKVTAANINGDLLLRNKKFTVDITKPTIEFLNKKLQEQDKSMQFDLAVKDSGSGIATITCVKVAPNGNETPVVPCADGQQFKYGPNLADGEHGFKVVAEDVAGNVNELTLKWTIKPVVCDLFNGVEANCKGGLKGEIFYLTDTSNPPSTVETYYQIGTKVDINLYLSQLFVPTILWSNGFQTTGGTYLRDNNNNILIEYFALRLTSILKLSDSDSVGNYQVALLSDDGSQFLYKKSATSEYTLLVDNDGLHSTRLQCATEQLALDKTSRVPIQVKYYQGPRTEIALTLMWRPWPTNSADVKDPLCGVASRTDFFGPEPFTDFTTSGYSQLLSRGWKVLKPENFILDENN